MKILSKWLKKYFIPHKSNAFEPHFLRHQSMMISLLVIIIIELAFLVQIYIVLDKTNFLAAVLPGILTTITNEKRAQNDAPPLTQNDLLTKAAQLKAEDMATRGYFAHTSPDGKTPWYWLKEVGYLYSKAGENLAVNFFESSDVAEAWMNSPSHRENILKKSYTEIGIGVANGIYEGRSTVFVAQFFGTPISANTSFETSDATESQTNETDTSVKKPEYAPVAPAIKPEILPKETIVLPPAEIQVLSEETSAPTPEQNEGLPFKIKTSVEKVLASPSEYVTLIFGGGFLLIIVAVLLVIFLKSERRHPLVILRGVVLMAIILIFSLLNMKLLHIDTKVGAVGISADAVAF